MPENWKKVEFKIKWHGADIRFIYEKGRYTAFIEKAGECGEVPFSINGELHTLTAAKSITI